MSARAPTIRAATRWERVLQLARSSRVWGGTALPLSQKNIGSCVAVSGAGVCDGENAMAYHRQAQAKPLRVAPEGIYGGRPKSQAASSAAVMAGMAQPLRSTSLKSAGWYSKELPRIRHRPERWLYRRPLSRVGQYGNGGQKDGINGPFDAEARKNKFDKRARISNLDELIVARKLPLCRNVQRNRI